MKKSSSKKKFLASAVSASIAAATVAAPMASAFSDVKSDAYYYEAVKELTDKGIINGFTDGSFKPDAQVTRGQVAQFLASALKLDTSSVKDPGYKDIKGNRFYKSIAALSEKGVIDGFKDGTFRPNEPVTRAQAAKFMALAYGLEETINDSFTDVKSDKWHAGFIGALVKHEITAGKTPSSFDPDGIVKRKEVAAFIYRAEQNKISAPQKLEKISDGKVTIDGTEYVLSAELENFFNDKNETALTNAKLKFAVDEKGIINKLTYLELTKNSSAPIYFDGSSVIIDGDVVVNSQNINISNLVINHNLKIVSNNENTVGLTNVTVKGKTSFTDASDTSSIQVASVKLATLNIDNSSLASLNLVYENLSLNTKGSTSVKNLLVSKNASISLVNKASSIEVGKDVTKLQLNGDAEAFNIKGDQEFTLSGDSDISKLSVLGKGEIKLDGSGTINQIEVTDSNASLKLSMNILVKDLKLPSGVKIEDVITNYSEVKRKIEKINGSANPDASTGTGGGSGGGSTAPSGSAALSLGNIAVENGTEADKITISNVSSGDIIKVYSSAAGSDVLSTVTASGNTVEINDVELADDGGNIWVTIKKSGRTESVRVMKTYYAEGVTVYNKAGTYTSADPIVGDVVIDADDVILQNMVIKGDLIISESVGEGEATLDHVTVEGDTIVKGGGINSIHFRDSVLATVIVNKNNGAIRIVAEGSTRVVEVQLESTVKLEENLDSDAEGFTDVTVSENLQSANSNLQVELVGTFDTINSRATQVRINLAENTDVKTIILNAAAHVLGTGVIGTAEVNANGSTISQRPQNVVLNIADRVTIGTEEVTDSYSDATFTEIEGFKLTQSYISLDLKDYVSNLTEDDFVITGSIDSASLDQTTIETMNFEYHPNLRMFTYNPLELNVDNLNKVLSITISPKDEPEEGEEDTRKLIGDPVTSQVTLGTGASGRLTDIFGAAAANATIKFRPAESQTGSTPTKETKTDNNGYYAVNLPGGTYVGEVSGNGYVTTNILVTVADDEFISGQDETIIRTAGTSATKIMLSWNGAERDVDSHLIGPKADGGEFHTFFADPIYRNQETNYVDLDWDDTDYFGPETTTIRKWTDGRYVFYVHNFSGEKALSDSQSVVKVFNGNNAQSSKEFTVPANTENKRYWAVFELIVSNNGTSFQYNDINEMVKNPEVLSNPKASLTELISTVEQFLSSNPEGDYTDLGSALTAAKAVKQDASATSKSIVSAFEDLREAFYVNTPPTIEFAEGITDVTLNVGEDLPEINEGDVVVADHEDDLNEESYLNLDFEIKDSSGAVVNLIDTSVQGTYTVKYTVTDSDGATAAISRTINIIGTAWNETVSLNNGVNTTINEGKLSAGLTLTEETAIQFNEISENPFSVELEEGSEIPFKLTSTNGVDLAAYYRATKPGTDWENGWGKYLMDTLAVGVETQTAMFNITFDGTNYRVVDGTQGSAGNTAEAQKGMKMPADFPEGTYTFEGKVNGSVVAVELTVTNKGGWILPAWNETVPLNNGITATVNEEGKLSAGLTLTEETAIQFNEISENPFSVELEQGSEIPFKLTSTNGVDLAAYYRATKPGTDWETGWGKYLMDTLAVGVETQTAMFNITFDGTNYRIVDGTQGSAGNTAEAQKGMKMPADFPEGTYTLEGEINGSVVSVELIVKNDAEWHLPQTVTGTLTVDPTSAASGDTVTIRLNDPDLNTDATSMQDAFVSVGNEAITLTETEIDSGIFESEYTIAQSATGTITITYVDSSNEEGINENITAAITISN